MYNVKNQITIFEVLARPRFNGADYKPERDNLRLSDQLARIYSVIRDGKWYTLAEIAAKTEDPEASISAQLRHLRKPRFGSHVIEREHISGGLYQYRMKVDESGNPVQVRNH